MAGMDPGPEHMLRLGRQALAAGKASQLIALPRGIASLRALPSCRNCLRGRMRSAARELPRCSGRCCRSCAGPIRARPHRMHSSVVYQHQAPVLCMRAPARAAHNRHAAPRARARTQVEQAASLLAAATTADGRNPHAFFLLGLALGRQVGGYRMPAAASQTGRPARRCHGAAFTSEDELAVAGYVPRPRTPVQANHLCSVP